MKKLKRLLIAVAGLSLSVGAAVGVGLHVDRGIKEAKAENESTLYLDISGYTDWAGSGKSFKLRCYKGETPTFYDAVATGTTNLYSVEVDLSTYDGFQFVRYDGDTLTNYANSTTDKTLNFYHLEGLDSSGYWSYVTVLPEGKDYFVNLDNVSEWWFNKRIDRDAHTFLDVHYPMQSVALEMDRVGDSNVFHVAIPAGGLWARALVVVRGDEDFDGNNWDLKRWNQTADYYLTPSNETYNAIYVLDEGGAYDRGTSVATLSDDYLIDGFGKYFLTVTTGYCDTIDLSPENQADIKDTFDELCGYGVDAKTAFANGTITHSSYGGDHANKADEAVSRYWDMTHNSNNHSKTTYSDFLDLGPTFMARTKVVTIAGAELTNTNNTAVIIIVAISVSIVLVIGGYLYIHKRREDR